MIKYIWFLFIAQVLLVLADESRVMRKRKRATAFGEIEEVFANTLDSKEDIFRDRILPMSMDYFVIDKPIYYGKKGYGYGKGKGGKKGGYFYGKKGGSWSGPGYGKGKGGYYYGKKGGYYYGKKGGYHYGKKGGYWGGKKGVYKKYVASSPSAPGPAPGPATKYDKDEPYVFGHSRDRE